MRDVCSELGYNVAKVGQVMTLAEAFFEQHSVLTDVALLSIATEQLLNVRWTFRATALF